MKIPFNLTDSGTRRYLLRCLRWRLTSSLQSCPVCTGTRGDTLDRKFGITSLVDCSDCGLLYRRPQEPSTFADDFYQEEYVSSLATVMPDDAEIERLVSTEFLGSEKWFGDKIQLLKTLGIEEGAQVLDYGASWGYGVWQLQRAGYKAMGLELSRPRACFGTEKLNVKIETDENLLKEGAYDAVFSNHVLEHIPNVAKPLRSIERLLKPGGLMVAFVPNGSNACRTVNSERFHSNWGRLHPIYLNDVFLRRQLRQSSYRLAAKRYDTCVSDKLLGEWRGEGVSVGELEENELLIAVRFGGVPAETE